jgi:hypothetical protein
VPLEIQEKGTKKKAPNKGTGKGTKQRHQKKAPNKGTGKGTKQRHQKKVPDVRWAPKGTQKGTK